MGLTIASYNVCQEVNIGIFTVSESGAYQFGQSGGDPCGNCGQYIYNCAGSSSSASSSMTIDIPFSSLVYSPENVWIAIMGAIETSNTSSTYSIEFQFFNASGDQIGSTSFSVSNNETGTVQYYIITAPVPSGTDTITILVNTSTPSDYCSQIWVTDVYFYSQPPIYYIEPLFFYNQSLT